MNLAPVPPADKAEAKAPGDRDEPALPDPGRSAPARTPPGTPLAATIEERWRRAIRLEVGGRDPSARWMHRHFAAAIGVAFYLWSAWISDGAKQRRPKLGDAMVALGKLDRAELAVSSVIEPLGFRAVPLEEEPGCPGKTVVGLAGCLAELTKALEDNGEIDAEEWRLAAPLVEHAEEHLRRLRVRYDREFGR